MEQFDLICIGSGPAGEKAATQAAYFGKRVAIIERAPRPGGAMVNTGTIPSKALRETALLYSSLRHRPVPGLSVEWQHHQCMRALMANTHLVEQEEHDRIEASFDRHGIAVYSGYARLVDPHTVEIHQADGADRQISAEFLLIATGSTPLHPQGVPFDGVRVVDADGLLRLEAIPKSLAIVGGGVIGSEYAGMFAEIGVDVTLIEPRNAILGFLDPEIRQHLMRSMIDAEIDVRLNAGVERIEPDDSGVTIHLEDGGRVDAQVLLWAAGRVGNTTDLGLEAVGLKTTERGHLQVDEHYRTVVSSIYAAGDVIGFPALSSVSMEQGRVAACSMFGLDFKDHVASLVPMGLFTIPPIATIGMSEAQHGRDIVIGRSRYRLNARGRILGDKEGLCKLVFDRESRALLGAAIIGQDAIELIHLAHPIIAAGEGIDYFINTCFNYPSLCELYKYATYDALQQLDENAKRDAA